MDNSRSSTTGRTSAWARTSTSVRAAHTPARAPAHTPATGHRATRPSALGAAFIKGVVSTLSDNYPERLAAVYLYPAGGVANMVFKMISPLMDPRTRNKVRLITSDALLRDLSLIHI